MELDSQLCKIYILEDTTLSLEAEIKPKIKKLSHLFFNKKKKLHIKINTLLKPSP
jgi:hypothetical protein